MKKTLFLATLVLAVSNVYAADQIFPSDGAYTDNDGSRLVYLKDGGALTYGGNITFSSGNTTVWSGPGTAGGSTDRATKDAYVTLSGVMSGNGTWQINEYANNDVADVVYALTNNTSSFSGTIRLAHGSGNANYVQLTLDNTGTAYQNAQVESEGGDKGKEIVNINGSATIGGLSSTLTANRLTGTEGATLTINTGNNVNKSFAGTVGSGNYFTSTFNEGAMTEAASSAISLVKKGAGTQTFTNTVVLNALDLQAGSLVLNGATTANSVNFEAANRNATAVRGTSATNGIAAVEADFATVSGTGSLTVSGAKTVTLNGDAVSATWSADNKTVTIADAFKAYFVTDGSVSLTDVNSAIAASSNVLAINVESGAALTGIKKPNSGNTTDAVIPPTGVTILGTGTVQVDGDLQYHNQDFLEQFEGVVKIAGGTTQIGDQGGKFANISKLELASGGTFKGWSTTFGKDILLSGGTLSDANNWFNVSGAIEAKADTNSTIAPSSGHTIGIQGAVTGTGTITKTGAGVVKYEGSITDATIIGDGANTQISTTTVTGATLQNLVLDATHEHTLTNVTLKDGVVATGAVTLSDTVVFSPDVVLSMSANLTFADDLKVYITGDAAAITLGGVQTIVTGLTTDQTVSIGSNIKIYVNDEYQSTFFLSTVTAGDGSVSVVVAPEPATATLSLLALAGLMARRKRH